MRNTKKLLALLLAFAMCLGLLSGCGNKTAEESSTPAPSDSQPETSQPVAATNDTLVVSCEQGLEGKFSPFFALSAGDQDVVDMFTIGSMGLDRVSNPILKGIAGETRAYNGIDYTYNTTSDIVVTENADNTVTYDLTIRDDMVFSDGKPVTIDDLIFSMYVVLDPTYDGNVTFYSVPIKGLEEYRAGMKTLSALLAELGEDNTDFTLVTEEQQTKFWNAVNDGGVKFAQEIVDYFGEGTSVATAAANWGFSGLPEDATAKDFFLAIGDNYGWNFSAMEAETAGSALSDLIDSEVYSDYPIIGIKTGDSADYVSGIEKTGDYSLRLTTTELDATAIYQLGQVIAPLHHYGNTDQYDYDAHKFGFPKGDLSSVRAQTQNPLGAGPFVFSSYANGVVTMDANPNYWQGEPIVKHLSFKESSEDVKVTGIETGTLDIADPSYDTETAKQIAKVNGFSEDDWQNFDGPVLTTKLIDYRGYGYVGMNPNLVKVGDDPYSEQSKDLRKAIATIIAVYRDEGIDSYYGNTASVINYPISNTSWAAPQTTDDGYKVAYSVDVNGEPIYTAGMSTEDKYAAALEATLGYLEAAGFTVADGKVTAAPEGAKLAYQVEIGASGTGDHPSFLLLKNASEALASIGITLSIRDHANANALYETYQTGVAELWVAAWRAGSDPDMFQLYHSNGSTNYYHISDAELDETIMLARKSADQAYRKALYQGAMEIVMDCAVEIPIYQRSDCLLVSSERVVVDSLPTDMTPYWGWAGNIETVAVK